MVPVVWFFVGVVTWCSSRKRFGARVSANGTGPQQATLSGAGEGGRGGERIAVSSTSLLSGLLRDPPARGYSGGQGTGISGMVAVRSRAQLPNTFHPSVVNGSVVKQAYLAGHQPITSTRSHSWNGCCLVCTGDLILPDSAPECSRGFHQRGDDNPGRTGPDDRTPSRWRPDRPCSLTGSRTAAVVPD